MHSAGSGDHKGKSKEKGKGKHEIGRRQRLRTDGAPSHQKRRGQNKKSMESRNLGDVPAAVKNEKKKGGKQTRKKRIATEKG